MFYSLLKGLKLLLCWVDFLALTLLMYLLALSPRALTQAFYHRWFFVWCRHFVRALNVELTLAQHNVSPLPDHFLLVANHPSAFEDIGIPALFDVYSLAKAEVRDWPVFGRISAAAGTLYVQREDKDSRRAAAEAMQQALLAGKNLAVYPEGGCFGKRIRETFHYGPFDIAMQTDTPILPVFLHYEAQDDFEWKKGQTLADKIVDFITARSNRVTYHVFDAIDPAQFEDKQACMEFVHSLYLQWQARYLD